MQRKKPISLITEENAGAETLRAMREHEASGARMSNMKRTMLHNVPLFEAMNHIMATADSQLRGRIPHRAMIIFFHAVTMGNDCMVCGSVFRKLALALGVEDLNTFELTDEEQDLVDFAAALTRDANHIPDEVYERLQRRYDEDTLVILVMNAVLTMTSNYFNNITGVELDEELKPWYGDGSWLKLQQKC